MRQLNWDDFGFDHDLHLQPYSNPFAALFMAAYERYYIAYNNYRNTEGCVFPPFPSRLTADGLISALDEYRNMYSQNLLAAHYVRLATDRLICSAAQHYYLHTEDGDWVIANENSNSNVSTVMRRLAELCGAEACVEPISDPLRSVEWCKSRYRILNYLRFVNTCPTKYYSYIVINSYWTDVYGRSWLRAYRGSSPGSGSAEAAETFCRNYTEVSQCSLQPNYPINITTSVRREFNNVLYYFAQLEYFDRVGFVNPLAGDAHFAVRYTVRDYSSYTDAVFHDFGLGFSSAPGSSKWFSTSSPAAAGEVAWIDIPAVIPARFSFPAVPSTPSTTAWLQTFLPINCDRILVDVSSLFFFFSEIETEEEE